MTFLPRRHDTIDTFQSPPTVLDVLLPYIKKDWIVWECACGRGNLVKRLFQEGYTTIATDITTGLDFPTQEPGFPYEIVLTNLPYFLKNEFLQRCYDLGKPFALLLPVNALDTPKRQGLYKDYGLDVLLLPSQVSFRNLDGKHARFVCGWFTRGILPKPLIFT